MSLLILVRSRLVLVFVFLLKVFERTKGTFDFAPLTGVFCLSNERGFCVATKKVSFNNYSSLTRYRAF